MIMKLSTLQKLTIVIICLTNVVSAFWADVVDSNAAKLIAIIISLLSASVLIFVLNTMLKNLKIEKGKNE